MFFFLKVFALTVVLINLLQISIDGKKLEDHMYSFLTTSERTKPIRDFGKQSADNIDYIVKNKEKLMDAKDSKELKKRAVAAFGKIKKDLNKNIEDLDKNIKETVKENLKPQPLNKEKKRNSFYKK